MKRFLSAAAALGLCSFQMAAGEPQSDVLSIDYSKDAGMVAAAYRGGQVVVWDFESGRVKKLFNASAAKNTRSKPLAQFSAGGRRLAFTQEGDAGLISYEIAKDASTA